MTKYPISYLLLSFIPMLLPVFSVSAEDWKFNATPYAWMAGVNADLNARGRSVSVDKSFSDVLSNVDGGVMGRFEARNDDLILTTDLTYLDLGVNKDVRSADIKTDITETILEIGGGYHVGDFCLGENSDMKLGFDALAGARYFDADTTVRGPFGRDPTLNLSYWEPYIGPRVMLAIDDQWSAGVRTDIGGFDIGNDPEFSWQLTAGVKYQLSKLVSIDLGYKFLNIYDLKRKDASADMEMSGLILGVGFTF